MWPWSAERRTARLSFGRQARGSVRETAEDGDRVLAAEAEPVDGHRVDPCRPRDERDVVEVALGQVRVVEVGGGADDLVADAAERGQDRGDAGRTHEVADHRLRRA